MASREYLEAQDKRTYEHLLNPELGDYFHEMFSPVAVVIGVSPLYVITIEKTKPVEDGYWTWDVEAKPTLYTRLEFANKLCYAHASDKPWVSVSSTPHTWLLEELASAQGTR